MTPITSAQVTAVILAGGMGRRMGGKDKGQVDINGRPLIEFVLKAIQPQVTEILINANRNHAFYEQYGYPVLSDQLQDYQGPLAGFAAGLHAASTSYIVTIPCDGPMLSPVLVERLLHALNHDKAELAVAHDGQRLQPVYALIPVFLLDSLETFLNSGQRKIDRWYAQHKMALADFSNTPDTFININTPEDRQRLEQEGLCA